MEDQKPDLGKIDVLLKRTKDEHGDARQFCGAL